MRMHEAFKRLPKKLTISFPLWLIYGTKGENSPYYDIDKVMKEHAERGFNCVRIDSGAGLIHNIKGELRGDFYVADMFGEYEKIPRQQYITGDGGRCDLLGRLIKVFECAEKYGIYVILSQWYYLHTYWFHQKGDPICDELFALTANERIGAFAKFWHYILLELEKRGLDKRIVFVELFNESDDHPYLCGIRRFGSNPNSLVSDEERAEFLRLHEEALDFLKEKHPNLLFAYDSARAKENDPCAPRNADVFNFHNYYLWVLYSVTINEHPEWFRNEITEEHVKSSREGRLPAAPDWYDRVSRYNDIDTSYLPDIEKALEQKFIETRDDYIRKINSAIDITLKNANGRPIVCGEGVSYICHKDILWEEHSDSYWEIVRYGLEKYKEAGLWGTVIRTCCGPEDPCWTLCKDKLLELNTYFLQD